MTGPSAKPLSADAPACPLADWSAASMSPFVDTVFEMDLGDGAVEPLTLISVTASSHAPCAGGRLPFSLVFRSTRPDFHAPQGCWLLRHATLGNVEVFLVPIGPDASGMCYEAVFN